MSLLKVLDDWSDYEMRKARLKGDVRDFVCTEPWEVNYLIDKIKNIYPSYSGDDIHKAILQRCREEPAPHPRRKFVKSVLNELGLFV